MSTATVVWVPLAGGAPLAEQLPHLGGMPTPHCVEASAVESVGGHVRVQLDLSTLERGVLVSRGGPPGSIHVPGDHAYRDLLRAIALLRRDDSLDALCARTAAEVRQFYGAQLGLQVLRRAAQLVPGGPLTRGDLIALLVAEAANNVASADESLREAAALVQGWMRLDTSRCQNEMVVMCAAVAALRYSGETDLSRELLSHTSMVMPSAAWLDANRARLEAIMPGDLQGMEFLFAALRGAS